MNKFLQDRDDNFYSKYLEELKVDRFNRGENLAKAGSYPESVFFIMNGVVKDLGTGNFFEAGQMINHDYVLRKVRIERDCIAETDVSVLKYDVEIFQ